MPSLKAIRKRIGTVKNTRKITRAMKMVAAAKLRRAQDAIIAARPYATARRAAANSRAIVRIAAAPIPITGATRSGAKRALRLRSSGSPSIDGARRPGRASPSAKTTCSRARSSSASPPGRMKWCASAAAAVSVRRGSTTTTLPPRARIAASRSITPGAVIRLPFDAAGLAPRTRK